MIVWTFAWFIITFGAITTSLLPASAMKGVTNIFGLLLLFVAASVVVVVVVVPGHCQLSN
jgi:hypothetical protein